MRTAVVASTLILGFAGAARGDGFDPSGQYTDDAEHPAPRERSHTVAVQISDRIAHFTVTRSISNPDVRVAELQLAITLPTAAVARQLRVRDGARWLDGTVLAAADARARWTALTETGAQLTHGPTLLAAGDLPGLLALHIYPLAPGATTTVTYGLDAPVCAARGRWITDYPLATTDLAPVAVTITGPRGAGRLLSGAALAAELGDSVDDACADDVPLRDDPARVYLVVDAPAIAPIDLAQPMPRADAGVRAQVERARAAGALITTVRLEVAAELARVPRDLRIVFVVDASISEGAPGIAAQLAWIRAYLEVAPDAVAQIVLYRRFAERVVDHWLRGPALAGALAALPAERLAPGNGSHLDRGLAMAAELLARAPHGPARVIAFTDEQWRPSWFPPTAADALARLPATAVVHFVATDGRGATPALERLGDDDPLDGVAATWGGMLVFADGAADASADGFRIAVRPLVQPIGVDRVTITGGVDQDRALATLATGAGRTLTWLGGDDQPVVLAGQIWGRPWRRVITPAADPRFAALVLGDDVGAQLPATAIAALARVGHAVSSETSLFAVDPAWPAAVHPDDWVAGGAIGDLGISGSAFTSSTGATCHMTSDVGYAPIDPAPLAARLAPRVRACAVQGRVPRWDVAIELDTTGAEIVDVDVKAVTATAATRATEDDRAAAPAFLACVTEAAWELSLDASVAPPTARVIVPITGAAGP